MGEINRGVDELIKYLSAENAVKHKGNASMKAVLGGVLVRMPELKKDIAVLSKEIAEIVKRVNSLSIEEQEKIVNGLESKFKLEKKEKPLLKPLKDAEQGKVVMRFEPSPSGPLHIGHAYILALNYEYIKHYKGKLLLRISDTNPLNIDPDAYRMIVEDAKWLCEGGISKVVVQSDRIPLYYEYVLKLLEEGHAYVCTCSEDDFRKMKMEMVECPCRNLSIGEQVKRWKKMLRIEQGYSEGEAVVRFKTDMTHKNPAMRDFPLFRIMDEEHPRQGRRYRVWPLMNFSVAIDDMDEEVTHTLRGKDHADNAKKQALIHKELGFKTPVAISVGRINFEGFKVSASETRAMIDKGEYDGWTDVRIPFLASLRRRGYRPEALRMYALDVGVSKSDKSVHIDEFFKIINSFNKEIIDSESNRYFFVKNPVKIHVEGVPDEKSVELDLHPDKKNRGREFIINSDFFIDRDDLDRITEGDVVRLMGALTFRKEKDRLVFVSYDLKDERPERLIHWLPVDDELIDVEVIMNDNSVVKGKGEKGIMNIKDRETIQFERFGFCTFEKRDGELFKFVYLHK